jgi:aflatoxin B1 aldehyde reductase
VAAGDRFIIDTKVDSREPGAHKKENVLKDIDDSLAALKIKQINIELLHLPERSTPFEETVEAMDEAIRDGKIKHWGVSNYTAAELKQFLDICERRGLAKPVVYQGQYNPIVRGAEKELFPLLREHGMAYSAYSPAAAGFFAGAHKNTKKGGRYDSTVRLARKFGYAARGRGSSWLTGL